MSLKCFLRLIILILFEFIKNNRSKNVNALKEKNLIIERSEKIGLSMFRKLSLYVT